MPDTALCLALALLLTLCSGIATAASSDGMWPADARERKRSALATAAANAVAQQRTVALPSVPLAAEWSGTGGVTLTRSDAWDADGDGGCWQVTLTDIDGTQRDKGVEDRITIRFSEPVDGLARGTGIAFWIRSAEDLSPHLRLGAHFKGPVPDAIVFNDIPVVQRFGDNPHRVYVDWGHAFANSCAVMATPPNEIWSALTGVDLPLVHRQLPARGDSLEPASGTFWIDGLELVDIYDGSFDSERFDGERVNRGKRQVAQGRTQQVARLCAGYGGAEGRAAAVRAMDMMVRLQSWDGSWPEMRTRLQGEFTHGMVVADLAYALRYLREAEDPALRETVVIRHFEGPRDAIYETMIYRGAMSRAPGPISEWRDSYCSGKGALTGGCNRPMVYIVSQHVASGVMSDPERAATLRAEYERNVDELMTYQGATAGGWPIFGEGNAFKGAGIRFDLGYTMDHVEIMAYASRVTDDPRWGEMMRRFDRVVATMIKPDGRAFEGGFNERGGGKLGGKAHIKWNPDLVHQEALRHGAPHLAQWGYHCAQDLWRDFPAGMWAYARTAKGYGLGAFLTWLDYDQADGPEPSDQGVVFPRQWPIWSARWYAKDGSVARSAPATVQPDGSSETPWSWEVGQFPEAMGLPLACSVAGGAVEIQVLAHAGLVSALDPAIEPTVAIVGRDQPPTVTQGRFTIPLDGPTEVSLNAGGVHLRFAVTPLDGATALDCQLLRAPPGT